MGDAITSELVKPSTITLFLCGDVMTGRGIDQIMPHSVDPKVYEPYVKDARDYIKLAENINGTIPKHVKYTYIWGDALKVWQQLSPALKIINLETSITTHNSPWPDKVVQYRMHPKNIAVLTEAGIDYCSLANNHTLDWGRAGLEETLQVLSKTTIKYGGAGLNLKEADKPVILKSNTNRVIIISYGSPTSGIPESWAASKHLSGINLLPNFKSKTIEAIHKEVKAVKQPGDIVIFSVHWGANWGYTIPPLHIEFAHQLIDNAEIDMVYGHSSHHPLGIEVYKSKLILYGAGDFINDYEGIRGHEQYRPDISLMYFPVIALGTGKLSELKLVPMQIRKFQLKRTSGEDTKWVADVLDRECKRFGASIRLNNDATLSLLF